MTGPTVTMRSSEVAPRAPDHLVTLDCLRGFAALSVCLFHFTASVLPKLTVPAVGRVFDWGRYGVEVFFVISGFILPHVLARGGYDIKQAGAFLWKRVVRICPPSYAVIALTLLQYWVIDRFVGSGTRWFAEVTWPQVFHNLFYTVPFSHSTWLVGVFWTLAVEFQFYALLAVGFTFTFRSVWSFLLVTGVLVAGSFAPWPVETFLLYAPFFLSGGACLLRRQDRIGAGAFVVLVGALAVSAALVCGWIPAAMGLGTALAIAWLDLRSPIWRFLGAISYSLYLTHILVGSTAENMLLRLYTPDGVMTRLIMQVVVLTAAIGFAWVFYRCVELPFVRLAQGVSRRQALARMPVSVRDVAAPGL